MFGWHDWRVLIWNWSGFSFLVVQFVLFAISFYAVFFGLLAHPSHRVVTTMFHGPISIDSFHRALKFPRLPIILFFHRNVYSGPPRKLLARGNFPSPSPSRQAYMYPMWKIICPFSPWSLISTDNGKIMVSYYYSHFVFSE